MNHMNTLRTHYTLFHIETRNLIIEQMPSHQ